MSARPRLDASSILPHGGRARFVTEVVETGEDELVCVGRIPVGSPFASEGTVRGFVLLELAAQAAAIEALSGIDGGRSRPRVGYLARANGLSWTAEEVPAGEPLTATVRRRDSVPPLYNYHATVTRDGIEVLSGGFSIYVDEPAD